MLRVTLEIVPYGIECAARVIDTLTVSNIGGDKEEGSYVACFKNKKKLIIRHYPRKKGAWNLIRIILNNSEE